MTLGRRKLLKVGCGAACLGVIGCGPGFPELPVTMDAGSASSIAMGSLTALQSGPAAIGRDATGIYAVSLICTHAGCDIRGDGKVTPSAIVCDCHGSVFDGQGAVLQGPATQALPHLVVTEDAAGELTVHGDQTTAASTRI